MVYTDSEIKNIKRKIEKGNCFFTPILLKEKKWIENIVSHLISKDLINIAFELLFRLEIT